MKRPRPPSPLESKKAADVATLSLKITPVLGCAICAVGIAFDIVDRYWSGAGYEDWKGAASGHECNVTRKGVKPEMDKQLQELEAAFAGKERTA